MSLGTRCCCSIYWNEWSEGHYLAPHREYGFGYLDAVRRVFSEAPEAHHDLVPGEIGRGPYERGGGTGSGALSWVGNGAWTLLSAHSAGWKSRCSFAAGRPLVMIASEKNLRGWDFNAEGPARRSRNQKGPRKKRKRKKGRARESHQ